MLFGYPILDMEVESEASGGKGGKRAGEEDLDSPSKRRDGGEITLASIQRLLQTQTKEIQAQTAKDIQAAVDKLEKVTTQKIKEVKDEMLTIKHHVSQQDGKIDDLQRSQDLLAARISALESKGSNVSTTLLESEKKLAIIIGGWGPETRREDLLEHLQSAISSLGIANDIDDDPVVPGLRRGFGILSLRQRDGEGASETRDCMNGILRKVANAKEKGHGVEKVVWASASKSPQERQRAAHASKVRKLIHTLCPQLIRRAETEYATGSLWLNNTMVCSVTRPKPQQGKNLDGKAAHSWMNSTRFAEVTGVAIQDVDDKWNEFMQE